MSTLQIEEFKEKHIEEAAKLFQKDYSKIIGKYTYLPEKFNKTEIICSNLKKIISENPAFIAISSNQIIGYVAGYSHIKELKGSFSGSYIPEWGHSARSEGKDNIYENLYSTISRIWANNKDYTHIISFLVNKELLSTFQMLGFGMQVIDAIIDLNKNITNISSEYKIESANKSHVLQLKEFAMLIDEHLESAPIFLKRNRKKIADEQIIENFLSKDKITLIATQNGEIVSCLRGVKNSGNVSILDYKGTFGINFGYTKIGYRKTGIASILLQEILKIAKKEECSFCSVDFESQNIEGRNFWLKYFEPIVYSMIRKVDDRILY
jgi:hypothetical protein